jgi:hypothetical protein
VTPAVVLPVVCRIVSCHACAADWSQAAAAVAAQVCDTRPAQRALAWLLLSQHTAWMAVAVAAAVRDAASVAAGPSPSPSPSPTPAPSAVWSPSSPVDLLLWHAAFRTCCAAHDDGAGGSTPWWCRTVHCSAAFTDAATSAQSALAACVAAVRRTCHIDTDAQLRDIVKAVQHTLRCVIVAFVPAALVHLWHATRDCTAPHCAATAPCLRAGARFWH